MQMVERWDFWLNHPSRCMLFMPQVLPMGALHAKTHLVREKVRLVLCFLRICETHREIKSALFTAQQSPPDKRNLPRYVITLVIYIFKMRLTGGGRSGAGGFAPSLQMSRLSISRVLPSRAAPSATKDPVDSSVGVGGRKSLWRRTVR